MRAVLIRAVVSRCMVLRITVLCLAVFQPKKLFGSSLWPGKGSVLAVRWILGLSQRFNAGAEVFCASGWSCLV